MKFKQTMLAAAFSAGLFAAASANAVLITINEVVDLSGSVIRNEGFGDFINSLYSFDAPVQISNGDKVDMTIMFSAGQSIQMANLGLGNRSWVFGWLYQDISIDPANTSYFTIDNSYVDLLDAQGSVLRSVYTGTITTGIAHIGPDAEGFLVPDESLLISGYHTYFDVASIENNPSHYCGPWLYLGADQLQLNGVGSGAGSAGCGGGNYGGGGGSVIVSGSDIVSGSEEEDHSVPEPETYTMLLAGLGLLSFTARRRKQRV